MFSGFRCATTRPAAIAVRDYAAVVEIHHSPCVTTLFSGMLAPTRAQGQSLHSVLVNACMNPVTTTPHT
jgi:hypothetical protein